MANLRSGTPLWTNASVSINGTSAPAGVSDAPYVALFITNSGGSSTNITVQAASQAQVTAGVNADLTNMQWFDYSGSTALTVPAGSSICYDLSPFAPAYIRLKSSAATTLTAFVSSNG